MMLNIRIAQLRRNANISQVELAQALGVSKQAVSNWENDNVQPSINVLIKIAEYFSVTTDYLLGLSDNQYLQVSGISEKQLFHIQQIINDLKISSDNSKEQ